MPVAARDLNGLAYYAWSFSLFVIGMLFATVVAGRLSDRIGPAKPLLVGMVIFVVGLVVAGSAEHMLQLVGGRLVQGLGSGADEHRGRSSASRRPSTSPSGRGCSPTSPPPGSCRPSSARRSRPG